MFCICSVCGPPQLLSTAKWDSEGLRDIMLNMARSANGDLAVELDAVPPHIRWQCCGRHAAASACVDHRGVHFRSSS
jgi:hypothetical protein